MGLLLLFTACPSETFCDLEAPLINGSDEIIFMPDKQVFNVEDTLNIKVSIPSKGSNNDYDIYGSLGVENSTRFTNISQILKDNMHTVKAGKLANSQIVLSYSSATDSYEFNCEVILKRNGEYKILGDKESFRFIKNESNCEYIDFTTTIKGINQDGFYEFTVE